jgi:MSHA biogenesis protein MshJ
MKQWWQQQVVRIDALSLRERAFLFLSVIVVCMALADVLWLSPAQVAHQQATQRFAAQGTELSRLRDELKSTAQPVDASKAVRDDIAAANARLEAVNQEIKEVAPLADGGPALEQVLVQFLRRQEGLTLLSTGTLKQDAAIPVAPATVAAPTGLSRRGMELRVAGPYPELVRYVKTLEIALPALRWGALQLKSEKQPPELTLQVYVVGVQP